MADVATASHISIFFSFLFGLCLQIALCSENVPDCLKLNYALMNDYMSAERSVAKGCIPSVWIIIAKMLRIECVCRVV